MKPSAVRAFVVLLAVVTITNTVANADTYAVFKSNDGGETWTRSDAGLPVDSRINAFGFGDGVIYAGTDLGIFLSGDRALRWQPRVGAAMSSGRVIALAVLGRKVFAGTDGNGMLVSSDRGESWRMDRGFSSRKIVCLLVHNGRIYAGTEGDGVSVCNDTGEVWVRLDAGLPPGAQVFTLSGVKGKLFAGLYSRGLYRLDEGTQLWVKVGPVVPLELASVRGTLIAGHNPGGLYWSDDLGDSWTKGISGSHASSLIPSLLEDNAVESLADVPVWKLASNNDLVFAGASGGIYSSRDRGRTWTRARAGLPDKSPGIAILVTEDFILAGTQIQ